MNVNGSFSRQQFIGGLAAAFGGLILPVLRVDRPEAVSEAQMSTVLY